MEIKENNLRDHSTLKLILLLIGIIFIWFAGLIFKLPIMLLIIVGLPILYIIKNKNVEKKDVLIGVIFGIIAMPVDPFLGVFTIPAYIGAVSVLKDANNKIHIYNKDKSILNTILFIVVVGGVLGAINLGLFLVSGMEFNPSIKPFWILRAFKAGITEEIIFRLLFFAICIRTIKDKPLSKLQNVICYLIITIPHTLVHFDLKTFNFSNLIILTLFFGIPFAITLRKRDLVSAIGIHMFVDLIRFIVIGF